MIKQLFPEKIDNHYDGFSIAKWFFFIITIITLGRSLAHLFLPDGGAQSIATIPLNMFFVNASTVIIGMFAQWGLTQLMFGILYVIVIWRYQSLIPLMWFFLLFEYSGRLLLGVYKPFETSGTAPGAIGNIIIPLLSLIMLILSLNKKKDLNQ
jgi:hypothetical protein